MGLDQRVEIETSLVSMLQSPHLQPYLHNLAIAHDSKMCYHAGNE